MYTWALARASAVFKTKKKKERRVGRGGSGRKNEKKKPCNSSCVCNQPDGATEPRGAGRYARGAKTFAAAISPSWRLAIDAAKEPLTKEEASSNDAASFCISERILPKLTAPQHHQLLDGGIRVLAPSLAPSLKPGRLLLATSQYTVLMY